MFRLRPGAEMIHDDYHCRDVLYSINEHTLNWAFIVANRIKAKMFFFSSNILRTKIACIVCSWSLQDYSLHFEHVLHWLKMTTSLHLYLLAASAVPVINSIIANVFMMLEVPTQVLSLTQGSFVGISLASAFYMITTKKEFMDDFGNHSSRRL